MSDLAYQATLHALLADLESIRIERAGMEAENAQRGACGASMAYLAESFWNLQGRADGVAFLLRELAQKIRENR